MTLRSSILIAVILYAIVGVFYLPPIVQDPAYHHFADNRAFFSIPNFWNVLSNLPFLVLGFVGLISFFKTSTLSKESFAVFTLFIGVAGIGFGSAYYHWNPNNATLVWDRIPMTITFMSFFAIVIGNYVDRRWSFVLLFPLILIGILSVIVWYQSELEGHGDLRLYALIQFLPMICIPLIIFIYPAPRMIRIEISLIILLYAIAKFFESRDLSVYNAGELLSGHTIKHFFAATAVYYILRTIKRTQPIPEPR